MGACIAITADNDHASELFAAALATPGAHRWPFDVARVELAYGEHLRRSRAITEARAHLANAFHTFERLAAKLWAERASKELRATGRNRLRGNEGSAVSLPVQEREIAMLAAAGMTNKQIAEQLFLSPRTVGTHLYGVFPKLGIASRAALRDALER